jgi:hypothetical protein
MSEKQLMGTAAIVVVGNFNPAIFQTTWFRSYKIIPEQEIDYCEKHRTLRPEESTKTSVVISPITTPFEASLVFESLHLVVTPDKYEMITRRNKFNPELLKTATTKVFHLLTHTPVTSCGFNFLTHWKLSKSGREILRERFLSSSSNVNIVVGEEFSIEGGLKFHRNDALVSMRVEESNMLPDGISIGFNFHRQIPGDRTEYFVKYIQSLFDKDLSEAEKISLNYFGTPVTILDNVGA